VVADAGAFAEALAGLPGAWGPEEGAAAAEAARVFALRLLAEATAGRAVEPDLARSDLAALHPGAAAALAALARGGGGGAALTARMAAALLRALPQVRRAAVPTARVSRRPPACETCVCFVIVSYAARAIGRTPWRARRRAERSAGHARLL